MKKLFLTYLFSILLLSTLNAQTKPKGIFLHHANVMKELNLEAGQRAKILEIKKVTDAKLIEIRGNTSLSPEEIKKELSKVYTERKKLQYEVLSAEQIKKLEQMRVAEKKKR